MSIELRRDPVIGRWVIVSSDRGRRPLDFSFPVSIPTTPDDCPFCPGHEDRTPPELTAVRSAGGVANGPGWRRRVFRSIAPLMSPDVDLEREGEGMFDMMTGFGDHEVIVDSADHLPRLADLPVEEIKDLALLWKARYRELRKDERIRSIILFANRGAAAGAHVDHTHSQIIAMPVMPRRLADELSMSYTYFQAKERCVFCDIIESDGSADRLVTANAGFVVVCPYASRFPYEMWILPRDHASHFEEIDARRAELLASALKTALSALNVALGDPAYSFVIHSAPPRERGIMHYHWHLEIMPRLTHIAGFEWGTGFYINPTPPEEAAAELREKIKNS